MISKGEFARRRGVTPGRVSQWLSEGKITAEAIVGEGRLAQIRESIAVQQLQRRLDPMQMTGNGLGTRLAPMPPQPAAAAASAPAMPPPPLDGMTLAGAPQGTPSPPAPDTLEDKIKRERLAQLERTNREGARQEAVNAGLLTDAVAARAMVGKATAGLLTRVEGALSEMATAISAEFKIPQRDVLHLLRTKFRDVRAAAAADLRAETTAIPALVDFEIDAADEDETEAA
ncbi:hypothetical protein [Bradyrhizobium sp. SZCCHNS3002]|uniref:hypothetical protein n=1 Tax=Bradyrhizobium sp. SZCCHNS3002 TaxID=3057310 RepID=UPI0028EBD815|nr:hypothetical protein [Bradyrhizobium sp. SZCCHNS3002]